MMPSVCTFPYHMRFRQQRQRRVQQRNQERVHQISWETPRPSSPLEGKKYIRGVFDKVPLLGQDFGRRVVAHLT